MALEAKRLTIHPENKQLSESAFHLTELADNEVRIQTLYSGISRNDGLFLEGKLQNQYFGVEVLGKITAVGKLVGQRKVGEIVGVYHENQNRGQFSTGYATYLQVPVSQTIFIPSSIPLEQASALLGTGVVAFNALEKQVHGTPIAVVGTNSLAYLTVQFAKKVFGLNVTLIGFQANETIAQQFGADNYLVISSSDSINKLDQKFDSAIITDTLPPAIAKPIQNIVIRTGRVYVAAQFGYSPEITVFELVVNQREFVGVKRGNINQSIKALEAASHHNIRGKVQVFQVQSFKDAFVRAKEINYSSEIILKY